MLDIRTSQFQQNQLDPRIAKLKDDLSWDIQRAQSILDLIEQSQGLSLEDILNQIGSELQSLRYDTDIIQQGNSIL